ncbi:hypothetical protein [Amycolatopsis sp. NPDC004378]
MNHTANTSQQITLRDPYGTATITTDSNPDTGRVLYRVTAPRISGTLTLYPVADITTGTLPMITGTGVDFGNTLNDTTTHRRSWAPCPDPLTINKVQVVGTTQIITHEKTEHSMLLVYGLRAQAPLNSEALSDPGQDRLDALIRALYPHWHARDDMDTLTTAVIRIAATAEARQARTDADRRQRDIDRLTAERNRLFADADTYQQLANPT